MSPAFRQAVRERAGGRCEFCRLPDWVDETDPFHFEHVVPRQHSGQGSLENCAWACSRCNRYKGPNLASIDPDTSQRVWLFNPRQQRWEDHFAFDGPRIRGRTPEGRATVWLLRKNVERRVELRLLLQRLGF